MSDDQTITVNLADLIRVLDGWADEMADDKHGSQDRLYRQAWAAIGDDWDEWDRIVWNEPKTIDAETAAMLARPMQSAGFED